MSHYEEQAKKQAPIINGKSEEFERGGSQIQSFASELMSLAANYDLSYEEQVPRNG